MSRSWISCKFYLCHFMWCMLLMVMQSYLQYVTSIYCILRHSCINNRSGEKAKIDFFSLTIIERKCSICPTLEIFLVYMGAKECFIYTDENARPGMKWGHYTRILVSRERRRCEKGTRYKLYSRNILIGFQDAATLLI